MVIRQADYARPKLDGAGALGRGGQVHLGRRDDLPAGAVVLADPGFVETELVEPLDQLHVALQGIGRVSADLMERGHENPKLHPRRQSHAPRVASLAARTIRAAKMGPPGGRFIATVNARGVSPWAKMGLL